MQDIAKVLNRPSYKCGKYIGHLLARLGVEVETIGFWTQSRGELEWIFERAKKAYRERIVKVQPRTINDDGKTAADLNELWQELQKRFEQHFENHLIPTLAPLRPLKSEFSRRCEFRKCGKEFKTTNTAKRFCNRRCGMAEFYAKRRELIIPKTKVCAYSQCGGTFTTTSNYRKYCCKSHRWKQNHIERKLHENALAVTAARWVRRAIASGCLNTDPAATESARSNAGSTSGH